MNKLLFLVFLAVVVALNVIILGRLSLPLGWWGVLIAAYVGCACAWGRFVGRQAQESEFKRVYEASPDAAFSALCGALASLDYRITARDPRLRTLDFKGGRLGPWLGRFGVACTAAVRQTTDGESEIVITGRVNPEEKDGVGLIMWEQGLGARVAELFDRVQATVVTYSMIDEGQGHAAGAR